MKWDSEQPAARVVTGARIAIAGALALLLAHAWLYRFLCDDAFISFRYAVNLSHGAGLVFNPGMERVEGYSNFLWVLILAGLDRIGIRPEVAAVPLSLLLTLALGAVVARFAWRRRTAIEPGWVCAVPVLLLAATRSVAVWSTSGLETRLFELLVVAGALRLVGELETIARGERVRSIAVWWFALAALTRPDGLLVALCAFGAGGVMVLRTAPKAFGRYLAALAPFALLVGAHFVWRHAYYGDWLPNTYYAKVGGRAWWSAGVEYMWAFKLEYGAWAWIPLIVMGAAYDIAGRGARALWIFLAVMVPHALYVASIGGDHFEYRPLDLYFPFAYVLMGEGLRWMFARRMSAVAAFALVLLALVGIWELPWQSHLQFPERYLTGFPGVPRHDAAAIAYLDPVRDPLYRWPPLNALAAMHRKALFELSHDFVGIRAEEHRLFLATAAPEGKRLRQLMDQGVLPRDLYVAMGSVGAIPYYSNVRTLDRVGLTDAHVAHSAPALEHGRRLMAHDKAAAIEYARERGVDLWTYDPVHLILRPEAPRMLVAVRDAILEGREAWVAALDDTEFILCRLPQGIDAARRRMPRVEFHSATDSVFLERWTVLAGAHFRAALVADAHDTQSLGALAFVEMVSRHYAVARDLYVSLVANAPDNPEAWEYLGICEARMGDAAASERALSRALQQNRTRGLDDAAGRVSVELATLRATLEAHAKPSARAPAAAHKR